MCAFITAIAIAGQHVAILTGFLVIQFVGTHPHRSVVHVVVVGWLGVHGRKFVDLFSLKISATCRITL